MDTWSLVPLFFFLEESSRLERMSSQPCQETDSSEANGRPWASPAHLPRPKQKAPWEQEEAEAWVTMGKPPPFSRPPSWPGAPWLGNRTSKKVGK